ncbi:phenylacetate--CoA ligase [Thermosulfurimonas marina]|uniref:Phenylacetate--CoA ligase n=1 Tax=Thermosulfurimonas marina TaxID=2047767 RepID=A0A6H1WR56_9BACT|nr:AMP-binding protein [Thermosulfurimonas marina]QJA05697.1 phenylacetate--CoA ligase [Thermosulfurimonas marina]
MEQKDLEYLSLEDWRQWHIELLQATLTRLYQRVPFYRESLEAAGLLPEDLAVPEDLSRFPPTTRKDLAEHYPYELFAVPLREIVRLHVFPWHPNPIVKGYTRQDLEALRGLTVRFLSAAGLRSDDILYIALEPGMAVWIEDLKEGAEVLGATVIPPSPRRPETDLRIMKDFRASVLATTPSLARRFLRVSERLGLPLPRSLRLLLLLGEPVSPRDRALLEEVFGVQTLVAYGIAEILGPGMAYECERRQGLHLAADHLYPEVVDPETGRTAPEGELLLTTLRVRANPLLRFRTGDRVRLLREKCPCGRTTPRLEILEPGYEERWSFRGVKIYRQALEGLLRETYGHLPEYRFRTAEDPEEEPLLEIRMNEDLFRPSIVALHEEAHRFERAFREFFGLPCRVKWVEA